MPSQEQISAHLDGEGGPELRARIAADKLARRELARYARNDQLLREAVESALGPANHHSAEILPFRGRPQRNPLWALPSIAAAAVVALAVGLGPYLIKPAGLVTGTTSAAKASVALNQTLSTVPSGVAAPAGGGLVKVNLSFKSKDGNYCRVFSAGWRAGHGAGVACFDGGAWRLKAWDPTQAGPVQGYETAGGLDSPSISNAIDKLGLVEGLDQAAETAALRSHWAPRR